MKVTIVKKIFKTTILTVIALLMLVTLTNAKVNTFSTSHTDIEFYTDNSSELIAAVTPHQGWHIYWQNPGDIGRPTVIDAVKGTMQIINQSTPKQRVLYEIMHEYFYDDTAYYKIYLPQIKDTILRFKYTECRDICRSQRLDVSLNDLEPISADKWQQVAKEAEKTFPKKIKLYSSENENKIVIKSTDAEEEPLFIPGKPNIVSEDSLEIIPKGKKWLISWQTEDDKRLSQALIVAGDKAYMADIIYAGGNDFSLMYILLLAFLGGIILNAMPCVFPILSLKIFALLQTNETSGRWQRGLLYVTGVWMSFMILTAMLVIFKKQGEAIGWGFQLQSPWFVGIMAVIFMLLFLFMIDWLRFPSFANDFMHKTAGLNDFTTGFFAVLIASPCTGPFMGVAVGYAFMQNSAEIFAVFTALAIGYALPYTLIELYPHTLSRVLPKPGRWMHNVKMILSLPVLLTALWLLWVLAVQLHANRSNSSNATLQWQPYDAVKIEALAAEKQNVFIDFTAKWCLTCQFNDRFLLQSDDFSEFVKRNDVQLFKADLTEDNDIYNTALSSYGRDGIPVYIYYKQGQYEILPVFFNISQLEDKK